MNSDGITSLLLGTVFIIYILYLLNREVDEHGMDEYDRWWGIAGQGRERGITGIIYTNGQPDLWANLVDHNPIWD